MKRGLELERTQAGDLPTPVEARRSKNSKRKPRIRSARLAWERRNAKEFILRVYRVTGDKKKAMAASGRAPVTVRQWLVEDKEFRAAFREIEKNWDEINEERVDNLNSKAIDVVEESMSQTGNPRLRFEAAKLILKRAGLLEEQKGREESEEPTRVVIKTIEVAPAPAGELIEGEGDGVRD